MAKKEYKLYYVEYEYFEGGRECRNFFYYHSCEPVAEARKMAERQIWDAFKQRKGYIVSFKEKPLHLGYKGGAIE